jgi:hypothetical protein
MHSDGGGLYLRVSTPTARSWVFRYMLEGKTREMGLGSYPKVSLAEARGVAADARSLRTVGKDPIAAREAVRSQDRVQAAKAITFRHCAQSYIAAHKDGWRSAKHAKQWAATLETHVMPIIGDVPVAVVDRTLIIRVLEKDDFWKTMPETASRVRGRIEAAAREYRDGDNPARWKGYLSKLFVARSKLRKPKHYAALPFAAHLTATGLRATLLDGSALRPIAQPAPKGVSTAKALIATG